MVDCYFDSLYVTRNERQEGLISNEDCVALTTIGLELYIHNNHLLTPDGYRQPWVIDGLESTSI